MHTSENRTTSPAQHQIQQNSTHQETHNTRPISTSSSSLNSTANGDDAGRSISPENSVFSVGCIHACSQCSASFQNRELLEKHELLHSPNATVVSFIQFLIYIKVVINLYVEENDLFSTIFYILASGALDKKNPFIYTIKILNFSKIG